MALVIGKSVETGEVGIMLVDNAMVVAEYWGIHYLDVDAAVAAAEAGSDLHITDHMLDEPYVYDSAGLHIILEA